MISKRFFMLLAMSALIFTACNSDSNDSPSVPECGNSQVEEGEECDDGNEVDDDQCSNECKINASDTDTPECGNGKKEAGEECDDGNEVNDDQCSNECTINTSDTDTPECGNGKKEAGEECDDGNEVNDDQCSNECKIVKHQEETWYSPNPGVPSKCDNGVLEAGEICEIGQTPVNNGWKCVKMDEKCVWQTPEPVCGNGILDGSEKCDDGNQIAGDGCSKKCTLEDDTVCQMRNGSKAKVLLVQDGDTLKIRLTNDGKCKSENSSLTVRIHGLECPECLKSSKTSTIDDKYKDAKACDITKKDPCTMNNLYGYDDLETCMNSNERGGYEAAEFVNSLIYSEENNAEVEIACETVSDTDSTCLLDNTRSRYLAYIGVKSNNATIDLGKAVIAAGLGLSFTAFTAQRTDEYCAAEKEAIANKAGIWANGDTFEDAIKASLGPEKYGWIFSKTHCK